MRLYFLRHGETDWNVEKRAQGQVDIPLNEYGRYLAKKTCEGYKNFDIDLCITSPLIRAKETAQITLEGKNVPIIDDDRIKEVAFGEYEGIYVAGPKMDPIAHEFKKFFVDARNYIPAKGGESVPELIDRAKNFLDDILSKAEYQDKNILISTHGAILRALTGILSNTLSIEHFFDTPVAPNCSTTIFDIDKNGKTKLIEKDLVFYEEKVKYWIIGDRDE